MNKLFKYLPCQERWYLKGAWMDGMTIQWSETGVPNTWINLTNPNWYDEFYYRVKPITEE